MINISNVNVINITSQEKTTAERDAPSHRTQSCFQYPQGGKLDYLSHHRATLNNSVNKKMEEIDTLQ